MKSLKLLIFLIIISPIFLMAEDIYVKVIQLKSKKHFSYVYSVLNRAKMNMMVKKTRQNRQDIFTIYSGPYKSKESQANAITHTKKYFANAKLVRFKPKKLNSDDADAQNASGKLRNYKHTSGFFIGAGAGFTAAPSTHIIETGAVSINEPKDKGINTKVAAGYSFKNGAVGSVNYARLDTNDLVFNNLYLSLNYRFEDIGELVPYFGASVGISSLKWNTSPIDDPNAGSNNDSDSILYGTQAGLIYEGFYPLSFNLEYNCMMMEHTTNITQDSSNSSKLEHNAIHSVQFFIHYNF